MLKDEKKKQKDADSVKEMLDDITDLYKIKKPQEENDQQDDKEEDIDQIDSNTEKDWTTCVYNIHYLITIRFNYYKIVKD